MLGFLSRSVEEYETNAMKKLIIASWHCYHIIVQALIALKYFLHGQTRTQFDATSRMDTVDGGVTDGSEAVQYLLRTYARTML